MGLLDFLFEKDEIEEVSLEEENTLKEIKNSPVLKPEAQGPTPLVEKSAVVRERTKHINVDEFEPKVSKVKVVEKPKQAYHFAPPMSPMFGIMRDKKEHSSKSKDTQYVQKPVITKSKLGTVLSPYYGEGFDVIKSHGVDDVQLKALAEKDKECLLMADEKLDIELTEIQTPTEINFETSRSDDEKMFVFEAEDSFDDDQVPGNFDHLTLDDILDNDQPEGTKRVVSIENISLFDGDNQ